MKRTLLTGLLVSVALLSGCTITIFGATEECEVVYDGYWRGETWQGYHIAFDVEDNAVTSLELTYELYADGAWSRVTELTYTSDWYDYCPISITDGCFSVVFEKADEVCTVSGSFGSSECMAGSLDIYPWDDAAVSIPWDAELIW